MSRLLTLLAPQAPAFLTAAGNRNQVPYTYSNPGNTNNVRQNRVMYRAPLFTGGRNPRLNYANYYPNAAGGESTTNLFPFNLRGSVEYPLGTFTQVTFAGQVTRAMALGDDVESDPVPVTIPAGATFYVRTWQEYTGFSGSLNTLNNVIVTPGRNEAAMSGTVNTDDRTMSGTIPAVASLNQVYSASLVRWEPTGPTPNVLIIGDSIARGSGDKTGTTGQGDYLSGTSPTAPFINIGNLGWIERGIGGRNALFSLAVQGKTSSAFTEALNAKQFALVDKAPPTHVVIEPGVNDLLATSGATTAANVIVRNQAIQTLCRARWGRTLKKVYWTTLLPVSRSTDAYATLGNQALSGTLPATGSAPQWSNFTDNTGASGRSYYNAQVRAGNVGADGFIDASAQVEDPTDGRFWRSDLGAITADGLHPIPLGHTRAALSLDPAALFG